MATENVTRAELSKVKLDRARLILNEIASLAHRTDRLCYWSHGGLAEEKNHDAMEIHLRHLRDVVCKFGLMADMASDQLDGDVAIGTNLQDWFFPMYPSEE